MFFRNNNKKKKDYKQKDLYFNNFIYLKFVQVLENLTWEIIIVIYNCHILNFLIYIWQWSYYIIKQY